jgi:AraC-like DNA-binding protein
MPTIPIAHRDWHDPRKRDERVQGRGIAKPPRNRQQFSSIPTASGAITRAAYARAVEAGLNVGPLLKASSLSVRQVENSNFRIAVKNQIKFLNLVADALSDEFLGVHLAESVDLRALGLIYYVLASSTTLGDALRRASRYSAINNEGVQVTFREDPKQLSIIFRYIAVPRLKDRHQIEFFVVTLLRVCRQLTDRHLSPMTIKLVHRRTHLPARLRSILGCKVIFGSDMDEVAYRQPFKNASISDADPYLNSLLVKYCEEAISNHRVGSGAWRLNVENAIAPLLPHGRAEMPEVARRLGISQRTLGRRLASEGLTFGEVLDGLRFELATRYLQEHNLPTSEVAWLLGYQETSAFYHAFKRWTGKTPRQTRSAL